MGRQYKYFIVDSFDYYGLLPYHTGECFDTVAEKRMTSLQRE
jgi:hypothetical protein